MDLVQEVAKLHLDKGDMLLVRHPADMSFERGYPQYRLLQDLMEAAGHGRVPIIFLNHDVSIESIDERTMLHLGYVRPEAPAQPATIHVETLAMALHEAGREAVEKGLVLNKVAGQPFMSWAEITEAAREGRRVQSRHLLEHFTITAKAATE